MKLSHNILFSKKFDTTTTPAAKQIVHPSPKLMEAFMKAVKVGAIRRASKEAQKGR